MACEGRKVKHAGEDEEAKDVGEGGGEGAVGVGCKGRRFTPMMLKGG